MLCSNCGKDVPFTGNVCPWCHADKSGDKRRQLYAVVGLFIGACLGVATESFWGAVGGCAIGFIGGGFVAGLTSRKP